MQAFSSEGYFIHSAILQSISLYQPDIPPPSRQPYAEKKKNQTIDKTDFEKAC